MHLWSYIYFPHNFPLAFSCGFLLPFDTSIPSPLPIPTILDCINSSLDWGSGNWSSLKREVWVYNPNVSSCWFSFVACGSPRTGPLLISKWSLPLLKLVWLGCQDEPEGTHDFMQHFWHIFARYTSFRSYKSNPISRSLSWKATLPEVQLGI